MRRILELIFVISLLPPISALADEAPADCHAPNLTPPQHIAGTGDEIPYPAASVRLNEEGQTTLEEIVDEAGKPTNVSVIASSYSPMLDAAAIEKAYAQRFTPAVMNGNAIACRRRLVVAWKLSFNASNMSTLQAMSPALYPPGAKEKSEEGTTIVRVIIRMDGQIDDVSVAGSSGFADLDNAGVEYMKNAHLTPAQWDGHPIRTVIYASLRWSFPHGTSAH
jgi:TonB family protein